MGIVIILIVMGLLAVAGVVQAIRLARTRGDAYPLLMILGIVAVIVALWLLGTLQPADQ